MLEDLIRSYHIAVKDLKEYYMKPGTISWGLLFPIAFTLAFMVRRGGLTPWLAPGMVSLSIFFGSTSMSAMSIVFERRIGSFERLLLYPASYTCVALGKTLSSFFMGILSSLPVLALIFIILKNSIVINPVLLVIALITTTFLSSSFGVLMSFLVKDPSQVMVVFNLIRFPMMFLSDILIPASSMPQALIPIMLLQPLTYITELLRYSITSYYDLVPPTISLIVTIVSSLILIITTGYIIEKQRP